MMKLKKKSGEKIKVSVNYTPLPKRYFYCIALSSIFKIYTSFPLKIKIRCTLIYFKVFFWLNLHYFLCIIFFWPKYLLWEMFFEHTIYRHSIGHSIFMWIWVNIEVYIYQDKVIDCIFMWESVVFRCLTPMYK